MKASPAVWEIRNPFRETASYFFDQEIPMSHLLERLKIPKSRAAQRLAQAVEWAFDTIKDCLTADGDVFFVFRKH
jgi:hypothetical protein